MALTVRTDETLERALTELADVEGTSRQEVIRRAVLDRHARQVHHDRVVAATSELLVRSGDVIDQLAVT